MDAWLKSVAPSGELGKWFSHDPSKWEEFKKKYYEEIKDKDDYKELVKLERKISRSYIAPEKRFITMQQLSRSSSRTI